MRHLEFNYLNIGVCISIIYGESNSKKSVGIIHKNLPNTLNIYIKDFALIV